MSQTVSPSRAAPAIAVVGAGIVGATTAYMLSRRGAHVTLIDRAEPGRGCSYGNALRLDRCTDHLRIQHREETKKGVDVRIRHVEPVLVEGVRTGAIGREPDRTLRTLPHLLQRYVIRLDHLVGMHQPIFRRKDVPLIRDLAGIPGSLDEPIGNIQVARWGWDVALFADARNQNDLFGLPYVSPFKIPCRT